MTRRPWATGRWSPAAFAGVLVLVTFALGPVAALAAVQAGDDRVYVDVNQPRFEDTAELLEAAELVVTGVVRETVSGPEGAMLRAVHRVDVADTRHGEHQPLLEVVQDLGSVDGRVHFGGQVLLQQGEPYLLFLEPYGQRYRTVGGAQGVFVPSGSGWVSAAPSRQDLSLPDPGVAPPIPGPGGTPTRTGAAPGSVGPDDVVRTGAPVADAPTPTATATQAPAVTAPAVEAPSVGASNTGRRAWLLAAAFVGGLLLGGAATLGLTRRRWAGSAVQEHGLPDNPDVAHEVSRAGSASPSDAEAAAVRGLIAVGDATDSSVVLAQVQRGLRQAGVEMIPAEVGHVFDTRVHHGVGWRPAPRPDLHLRVARVIRPGWRSGVTVLRPADVEVYRDAAP